jgi:transcriptional regulator with XRE-family HTH domain
VTDHPGVCETSLVAAANVRNLRRQLYWSQRRLAEEAGLSAAMITLLETGERDFTLPTLEKVSAALGVPPGDLLAPLPEPRESVPQDDHAASG